jgi:hypothetical protein
MWSPRRSAVKVAGKETIGVGLSGAAKLGDRFWGQNGEGFQNAGSVSTSGGSGVSLGFTRAREYQIVAGFASDRLPAPDQGVRARGPWRR